MSLTILPPYTPLSQTLELTKLVQSVDAFSSDVFRFTSTSSFFSDQAHDLILRVRNLEKEVREWDKIIFITQSVIPEEVLSKLQAEVQNLAPATKAIHEYFKFRTLTNQGNASLRHESPLRSSTPIFNHFRVSGSESSSSSNSVLAFSSYPPMIVSHSNHPSPQLYFSSPRLPSLQSSVSSTSHSPLSTTDVDSVSSDWSLDSSLENNGYWSSGSQY